MSGRLQEAFVQFGPVAGCLYLLQRALDRIGSPVRLFCYELMVQPVAGKNFVPKGLAKSIDVRRLEAGDPAFEAMPRPADAIASHLAQPTVCLGAFSKDRFVGYMWLCHGPYEEDEVRCTFVPSPEGEGVFDFDFYIFPEHRSGVVFARLWDGANEHLRAHSVRYSFSRVTRFNLESRSAHKHLGWRRLGVAVFLASPFFQLMVSSVAPFVHLSLGRSRGPRIVMKPDVLLSTAGGSSC